MSIPLLLQVCAALIAAFLFSTYTVIATESKWTTLMLLDTVSLAALFYFFFQVVTKIKSVKMRIAVAACISIIVSLTFIGNVFYYQVFHDWVHAELFGQWSVGLSIQSSVFENATWREISLALFVPLILSLLAVLWRDTPKKYSKRVGLLILMLCLSVHSVAASRHFEPSEHNFLVNLARELVVKSFSSKGDAMRGSIDPSLYPAVDSSRYISSTDSRYPLIKIPKEQNRGNSLFPESKQPNIVLILMESVRAKESGTYGAKLSFTPAFDQLARQGVLYKNFYANGTQTVRGELSLLCSFYPNYTGSPIYMKRPKLKLSSLPGILQEDGYKTMWISGFKSSYANKDGFLKKHGIEDLYDGSDLDPDTTEKIGWGYSDRAIFSYAESILDKQKEPFFAEIMTLSNHWPFDFAYSETPETLPETADKKYSNYCRGMYYTDWAMGEFMKRMQKKPYFNNTLFIITSDHGIWYFPPEEKLTTVEKQEAYFRMPLLFYAPTLLDPKVSNIVTSQIDVAPTVLDLLGIQRKNAFLGQSLLDENPSQERFALMQHVMKWSYRRGNEYIYSSGSEAFVEHYPPPPKGTAMKRSDEHLIFTLQGDLLHRGGEQFVFHEVDQDRQDKTQWVINLLKSNQELLFSDRIFDHLY
ncbi:MAG: LTA synthase family protein [Candidatus Electrothrix sp. Rat3]|nr:LTA synthase family protein [Candidatus Electrothrix rattekaaiensis]